MLNSNRSHNTESWRHVSAIADLAGIFEPEVQVCNWQRPEDATITSFLTDTVGQRRLQIREELKAGDRAQLVDLPAGEGGNLLRDDVALLTEILCELVDCPSVGLRFATIENAMCPRWHVDRVPIRLLCTYKGYGTQWLDDQWVDKVKLSEPEVVNSSCQGAASGDVVLLKGALWQGNESFGAVHRSPAITHREQHRMMLTLDPLFPA